jgi:hypothetical protein
VNVRWTLVDPNFAPVPGTDCDATLIDQDTPGTDITCEVEDANQTRVRKTVNVRVDQTAPSVTGSTPARPADKGGWWNHAVDWVFDGTDVTSGLASCDTVSYSGPDSATGDVAGDCRDIAGNSATGHQTIKFDDTAPTVTGATPARPPDKAGWWNHSVAWTFAGDDATSGLDGCDTVTYTGPDSATGDVAGDCRDNAGNAMTGHAPIKYDDTGPTVAGATPERTADNAGWWNHAVKWTFGGSDAISGLASCDAPTYSGPDSATANVLGDCRDNAGNSTTGAQALKFDDTSPTVTGATPARAADRNGWWNHAVDWTFAGSDATSGLASCDTVTYTGPDSATGDVAGTCSDNAGNAGTGHEALKYDDTAPNVTSATPLRAADRNGWWNHAIDFVFAGNDATSGLASCDAPTYTGPDSATADVAGDCRDNAGNAATGHQTIKFDDTAPNVTAATPERAADSGGWWNHAVKFTFTATDPASGVASCDAPTYSGPDNAAADLAGNCRDVAGNVAGLHVAVKYDSTPPTITTVSTDRPADSQGWWNHPVSVAFAATDATSGVGACDTITYSGPDAATKDVAGSCSDKAGNSSNSKMAIKYDATPPTITSILPERAPDYNGWWNHPLRIAYAGTDSLSGLAYCDTVVYSGSETPTTDVPGTCTDRAGNAATGRVSIKYDDQPPVLAALPAEVGSDEAVIHWSQSPDTVLTEVRRSPGIGGSPTSTVYSGIGSSFADPGVKNGETYTYSINARDQAANIASVMVTVTPPGPAPAAEPAPATVVVVAPDARASAPPQIAATTRPLEAPRLTWRRVKHATYYNVQLFRGKKKILSTWPKSTYLQLKPRWRYRGRLNRLTAGRYTWYVWPGFGRRAEQRYGRLLESRQFTLSSLPAATSASVF